MLNPKFIRILILTSIILMILSPAVSAHRVYLQEQIKEVEIKSWFGGGDPMVNADIYIYTIKNDVEELYLEDQTDSEGMYYFTPKLGVSEYRVVVSESGHKNEKTFDLTGGQLDASENGEIPLSTGIFSGLGYIFGIAGFAMYFSSRKSKN